MAENTAELSRRPGTGHLSVPPAVLGRVVRLEYARLTLVGLGEGVAALLAHALDLPDLADGFLELLHSSHAVSTCRKKGGRWEGKVVAWIWLTLVCSLECCTSESLGCGGTSAGSTSS